MKIIYVAAEKDSLRIIEHASRCARCNAYLLSMIGFIKPHGFVEDGTAQTQFVSILRLSDPILMRNHPSSPQSGHASDVVSVITFSCFSLGGKLTRSPGVSPNPVLGSVVGDPPTCHGYRMIDATEDPGLLRIDATSISLKLGSCVDPALDRPAGKDLRLHLVDARDATVVTSVPDCGILHSHTVRALGACLVGRGTVFTEAEWLALLVFGLVGLACLVGDSVRMHVRVREARVASIAAHRERESHAIDQHLRRKVYSGPGALAHDADAIG